MPCTKTRTSEFLSNYKFCPNSVDFRIMSSKELERWKNVQSFQLNQLVHGNIEFSKEVREMILLKYDLWSRALYEVENYFIEVSSVRHPVVTVADLRLIDALRVQVNNTATRVLNDHPLEFDTEFFQIQAELNRHIQEFSKRKIANMIGMSLSECFVEIVTLVIKGMQRTLIETYELVNLMKCKIKLKKHKHQSTSDVSGVFLIFTAFDSEITTYTGTQSISERINVYKRYFGFSSVFLKNYTSAPIPFSVAESIESTGMKLNYKLSSRFGPTNGRVSSESQFDQSVLSDG